MASNSLPGGDYYFVENGHALLGNKNLDGMVFTNTQTSLGDSVTAAVSFDGAQMHEISAIGARFENISFNNANLQRANLTSSVFVNCQFVGCIVKDAVLTGAQILTQAGDSGGADPGYFHSVDFTGAKFSHATIRGSTELQGNPIQMTDVDLRGADLVGSQITDVVFRDCKFIGRTVSADRARLYNALDPITPAEISNQPLLTHLSESLNGTNMTSSQLTTVTFNTCNLGGVCFGEAVFSNVGFLSCRYNFETIFPADMTIREAGVSHPAYGSDAAAQVQVGTLATGDRWTMLNSTHGGLVVFDRTFDERNLASADLSNMTFVNMQFTMTVMVEANLENSVLISCSFSGYSQENPLRLTYANMKNTQIMDCLFFGVDMRNVSLMNSAISGANAGNAGQYYQSATAALNGQSTFEQVDLAGANLTGATIMGSTELQGGAVQMISVDLRGADLTSSRLTDVVFRDCELIGRTVSSDRARLYNALDPITPAEISNQPLLTHLSESLNGTNMTSSQLTTVTFNTCNLGGVCFGEAVFSNVGFLSCRYNFETIFPADMTIREAGVSHPAYGSDAAAQVQVGTLATGDRWTMLNSTHGGLVVFDRTFDERNLASADLSNMTFVNMQFTMTVMVEANLENSVLISCMFSGYSQEDPLRLTYANMKNTQIIDCSFFGVDMRNVSLINSTIRGANAGNAGQYYQSATAALNGQSTFEQVDLAGANLTGATIMGSTELQGGAVQMISVDLRGADLTSSRLTDVVFRDCELIGRTVSSDRARLYNALDPITPAEISNQPLLTHLSESLNGTNMTSSQLTTVTFNTCNLGGVCFGEAVFSNVGFLSCRYNFETIFPADMTIREAGVSHPAYGSDAAAQVQVGTLAAGDRWTMLNSTHGGLVVFDRTFDDCNLASADLSNMTFVNMQFTMTVMVEANLENSVFISCMFSGYSQEDPLRLTYANMKYAEITDCSFFGVDMRWADLRSALFTTSSMEQVILEAAQYDSNSVLPDGVNTGILVFAEIPVAPETPVATVGGDPYVRAANGKVTKMPNKHGFYRMFQYDDIVVNIEQDSVDFSRQMEEFLRNRPQVLESGIAKNIITSGFFNKKIFVNSEGNTLVFDLFNCSCSVSKENCNYFTLRKNKNITFSEKDCDLYGSNIAATSLSIEWSHSSYGKQSLVVNTHSNPQSMNDMSMKSSLLRAEGAIGILARNYKAKLMAINSLTDTNTRGLKRQLKKYECSGKSLFHTKAIRQNETWYTVRDSKIAINRKF